MQMGKHRALGMENRFLFIVCMLFLFWGCSDYDDTALNDRMNDLEVRLKKLETACEAINGNMAALKTIVEAVNEQDCITGLKEIHAEDGTTVIGYTISFKNNDPITIYHGKSGADGHTPSIGIKKDDDEVYYWTLDGEWLLSAGNKVVAMGQQGTVPQFKIERNATDGNLPYWYISYDDGGTWQPLYRATGEDGTNGDSLFKNVELSADGSKLVITMNDPASTIYEIPTGADVITSFTFIPRYDDGKMSVKYREEDGQFYITAQFKVSPASSAAKIVAEWTASSATPDDKNVMADCTEVITRSPLLASLPVSGVSSDEETEGVVVVEMNIPFELLNKSLAVSVSAKTGSGNIVSSSYIPVNADELEEQIAYIPDPRPIPMTKGGLYYSWGDEFNTDGPVNEELWAFEEGFQRGQEPQNYVKGTNNAIVADGRLLLTAKKEHRKNPNYNPNSSDYRENWEYGEYTSASMNGDQRRYFLYGRIEVRAKIDPSSGAFPAVWTCGYNKFWPSNGEIDFMEFYDLKDGAPALTSNFAVGTNTEWVARWNDKFTPLSYYQAKDPDWIKKYHIYRMDWDEKEIKLYVDDDLRNSVKIEDFKNADGSIAFHNPQYMWLNLALKNRGGGISINEEQNIKFEVDYFRVYQKVVDHEKPAQVGNFTAESKGNLVYLNWDSSTDNGAAGLLRYDIYRGGLGSGNFIASTMGTGYVVKDAALNEETTYYVQALDAVGNYSLPGKSEATVTTTEGELHENNLVPDGAMESLGGFEGTWGSVANPTGGIVGKYGEITSKVGEIKFTVNWQPNTTYVIRALVNTNASSFAFDLRNVTGEGLDNQYVKSIIVPDTHGEWMPVKYEFTTTAAVEVEGACSFCNWLDNGVKGKIDNWELYIKE